MIILGLGFFVASVGQAQMDRQTRAEAQSKSSGDVTAEDLDPIDTDSAEEDDSESEASESEWTTREWIPKFLRSLENIVNLQVIRSTHDPYETIRVVRTLTATTVFCHKCYHL